MYPDEGFLEDVLGIFPGSDPFMDEGEEPVAEPVPDFREFPFLDHGTSL